MNKNKRIIFTIDILTYNRLLKLMKYNETPQSKMIRDCINMNYAQTFYRGKRK